MAIRDPKAQAKFQKVYNKCDGSLFEVRFRIVCKILLSRSPHVDVIETAALGDGTIAIFAINRDMRFIE